MQSCIQRKARKPLFLLGFVRVGKAVKKGRIGLFLLPSPRPKLHTDFDTMRYQNGVQFFYAKTLDFNGFSTIFND
jgi:hypothetical protein